MSGLLEGEVVSIAKNGNFVTNFTAEQLSDVPRGDETRVACDEYETLNIFPAEHGQPDSTFLAMIGESGFLELGIVGIPAADMLEIKVGDKVKIQW